MPKADGQLLDIARQLYRSVMANLCLLEDVSNDAWRITIISTRIKRPQSCLFLAGQPYDTAECRIMIPLWLSDPHQ
jgi:hypothetical protein